MNIWKKEPHPLLLGRMLGPQVPKDFKDNGCSRVPDLYLKWPCRIHDYQYWQLRRAWAVIETYLKHADGDIWTKPVVEVLGEVETLRAIGISPYRSDIKNWPLKQMIMAHHDYRQLADKYLRANIKTLTRLRVVDGQIKKRRLWSRRLWGRGLNWAFYIAVRIGAGRAAKKGDKADAAQVPTDYDPTGPGGWD